MLPQHALQLDTLPSPAGPGDDIRAPRRMGRGSGAMARIVLLYLITLFALATIIFVIPRAVPGDPLAVRADSSGSLAPDTRALYAAHYGLDRPLVDQYGHYLANLAQGDFGESIASQRPVTYLLRTNLPWTVLLVGTSLVVSSLISFRAGISAAWRRGKAADRTLLIASTGLHAVPAYGLATFFLIVFAVLIQAFPISGGSTPFTEKASGLYKLVDVARHLVLPATALTLSLIGTKFLLVRNVTIGVLGQDFMVLARAKGLPERLLKHRHAGRNTLLPFLNLVAAQVGVAVGGAIFVEAVFGYPGIGSLLVGAVADLDYPVIEACFLVLAVLVLTANLIIDLVAARLDPRVTAQ